MEKLTTSIETREYILSAMNDMLVKSKAHHEHGGFSSEAAYIESRGFFKGVLDGIINVVKFYYNIDTTELCKLRDKVYNSKLSEVEINTSNFIQHLNNIVV